MSNAAVKKSAFKNTNAVANAPDAQDGYAIIDNPVQGFGVAPSSVERPHSVEALQDFVRACGNDGTGLVPVSSAGGHRLTGICCREPHLQVDLSRWKAIPFASRRNRVVQLEAGVTYPELLEALSPLGLTLPVPLAPRSNKSVLAACCERTPVTWSNKQWEISDPLACMEFVFGTGDLFRTGSSGGPGSLERQRAVGQAQKAPLGPGATDFHRLVQGAQGSFGIATWITARAELKPTHERPVLASAESLSRLCDFVYQVQWAKWGEESFIVNRHLLAQLMAAQEGCDYTRTLASLPEWICLQNIAGFERLPAQRVEYQRRDIGKLARAHSVQLSERLGTLFAEQVLHAARTPCGDTDWRHALAGNALSISFQTTLDRSEYFVALLMQSLRQQRDVPGAISPEHAGIYVQPVVQNRACEIELVLPYDPNDPAQVSQCIHLEQRLFDVLKQAHAFFARPYGYAETRVFENNPVNTRLLRKLKQIFDPQRVLNPGKFGF